MDDEFRKIISKNPAVNTSKKAAQPMQDKHFLAPEIEIDTHETLVSIFEPVKIKDIVA